MDRDYNTEPVATVWGKKKGARLRRAPCDSSYRFSFISEYYGILRVLTIRTMTAMIRTAPTAITAQSK
jgi:hypothetical protein